MKIGYIIIDINARRFKTLAGWTTRKLYARIFTESEVHKHLKKLRDNNFLSVTFASVEIDKEENILINGSKPK